MKKIPKDITGTEIKVGDIIAVGIRSGNSGSLAIRVVKALVETEQSWRNDLAIKTTKGGVLGDSVKTIILPFNIFIGTKIEDEIKKELLKVNKNG